MAGRPGKLPAQVTNIVNRAGGNIMTDNDYLYLILSVVAMGGFSLVLAYASYIAHDRG